MYLQQYLDVSISTTLKCILESAHKIHQNHQIKPCFLESLLFLVTCDMTWSLDFGVLVFPASGSLCFELVASLSTMETLYASVFREAAAADLILT